MKLNSIHFVFIVHRFVSVLILTIFVVFAIINGIVILQHLHHHFRSIAIFIAIDIIISIDNAFTITIGLTIKLETWQQQRTMFRKKQYLSML